MSKFPPTRSRRARISPPAQTFSRRTNRWKSSSCRTARRLAASPRMRSATLLSQKPAAVLGLATGSSPLVVYDELAQRCDAGRISFERPRAFTLDEYVGLPADHRQRYQQRDRRGIRLARRFPARRGATGQTAWPTTSRPPARHSRPRSVIPVASTCRSSVSAPTGTSRSTNPGRHWAPGPASRR